ncbi:uncharacterized protein LOC111265197 isoform X2 [Varroa jacobsoni]|uniref:uncharacterized protein LOC111265197 isoform X2 n=1 Tax=Varroa jacobsoni TaxID=62625 RepID=UPI000BF5C2E8|nr:uncharacterized protein LOC111265197 isoform X2 [Varroa jacobsoni]
MSSAKTISIRRVTNPSQLPANYSQTPGGTLFGTTPGGANLVRTCESKAHSCIATYQEPVRLLTLEVIQPMASFVCLPVDATGRICRHSCCTATLLKCQ